MPASLFSLAEVSSKSFTPIVPKCGSCQLYKSCISPKMKWSGKGKKKILILGEAPGATEDSKGIQFAGRTGKFLSDKLLRLGIDMREDCWLTNSLACRPPANKIPKAKMVEWCRPNVVNAIKELRPEKIIVLGASAVKSLMGWLWKGVPESINIWTGWQIPVQRDGDGKDFNTWVCPSWHPSYVSRELEADKGNGRSRVLERYFEQHLEKALALQGRPWKVIPDYKKEVKILLDPEEAGESIRRLTKNKAPVAWDLENNMLKPDAVGGEIVSCSLSDGEETFAFPWHGEAIRAMREFISSDCPKIGWNAKYETRWILKVFGRGVRNWIWDGMLVAHALDTRKGTKRLKFQAIVHFGIDTYEDDVAPYLKSEGANSKNRIREIPLRKLLTYNALDSLLEYKLAQVQAKRVGVQL